MWAFAQDDDGNLFRVQPAHHVPSGGIGVAGHQRLGRHGPRAGEFCVCFTGEFKH